MDLLGVSIRITGEKVEVNIDRTFVEKETPKLYKVRNCSLLTFNCLSAIPKDMIGVIQTGSFKDYVNSFERKIWVVDNKTDEQILIDKLKQEIRKELRDRKFMCDRMMGNINKM